MNDRLEIQALRKEFVARRLKGAGNDVHWSNRDAAHIAEFIGDASADEIMSAKAIIASDIALKTSGPSSVVAKMNPTDLNFKFVLTEKRLDRAGDIVDPLGVDWSDYYPANPVVLAGHDSSQWPIASSSRPYLSAGKVFAIAQFPQPGVSAPATQAAAAIRSGLLNACSIGFIPRTWSFSKDPARPFGVDFKTISLLEWSICAVPCLPTALLVGPVAGDAGKAIDRDDDAREQRLAEARSYRKQSRLAGIPGFRGR